MTIVSTTPLLMFFLSFQTMDLKTLLLFLKNIFLPFSEFFWLFSIHLLQCHCLQYAPSQSAITCSKLTIETIEQGEWRRSGIFIVNFEHISHLVLLFLLLTLTRQMPAGIRLSGLLLTQFWTSFKIVSIVPPGKLWIFKDYPSSFLIYAV